MMAYKNNSSGKKIKLGAVQQKILLLLLGGLALGLSGSPRTYFKIVRGIYEGWKDINRMSLRRAIRSLYESNLLETYNNPDGTITLVLNKNGRRLALQYDLEKIRLEKPGKWDKKWRVVMFDIPESLKKIRESLRHHLRKMGFIELQKSAFIHPSDCEKEIMYLVEFYSLKKYVRFIVADSIDNGLHFKQRFQM